MKRLTKEYTKEQIDKFLSQYKEDETPTDLLKELKLSQLEDLEEELGINLITLFEVLITQHIYAKIINKIYEYNELSLNSDGDEFYLTARYYEEDKNGNYNGIYQDTFWLSNYRKTWALVKEDLTKE